MTKPNGKRKSWVVWKRKAEVEEFSKLITNLREEHDIKSRCCELCGKIHAKAFYSSIFLIVIHHNTEFETHNLYLICLRKLPFLKREKIQNFWESQRTLFQSSMWRIFNFNAIITMQNYYSLQGPKTSRKSTIEEVQQQQKKFNCKILETLTSKENSTYAFKLAKIINNSQCFFQRK